MFQTVVSLVHTRKAISTSIIYPLKKEAHHYDFPIKISFEYENVNCHEIFISNQILLKLECELDEYLYFPCVDTNTPSRMVNEFLEASIQR